MPGGIEELTAAARLVKFEGSVNQFTSKSSCEEGPRLFQRIRGCATHKHVAKVWRCLCEILGAPVDHDEAQVIASSSFSAGGWVFPVHI